VDAPIDRAFAVFTERLGDFKPPEHNLLAPPIAETVFEPRSAATSSTEPPTAPNAIDGPIRAVVDVTVEPLPDSRSRLTIAVDFGGHGIGKVLVPLVVRREARKEMPANLAALKQRLESG
jgi:hypothetical protein